MSRMDKYNEKIDEKMLSRTEKNKELYSDIYLNNTVVDLNSLLNDDIEEIDETIEKTKEFTHQEVEFINKNYDLNDYIDSKRKDKVNDNLSRIIDPSIELIDNEISNILDNINKTTLEEDLFSDLLPDNENTIITESNSNTTTLENIVSDTVLDNFVMNKEMNETHSFMDLDETMIENKKNKKNKTKLIPLILCIILFLIMIGVILYIVLV